MPRLRSSHDALLTRVFFRQYAHATNFVSARGVTWAKRRREGSGMNALTKTGFGARRIPATVLAALAASLLTLAALAVACGDPADERPAAPSGDPSITGVVTSATPVDGGDAVGAFLIDQGSGDYDKASVAVTDDTGWYRRSGDGYEAIQRPAATELTGKSVEVQFTGPVAESYPVQATAGWVIVED
jgi:hypothetical protein